MYKKYYISSKYYEVIFLDKKIFQEAIEKNKTKRPILKNSIYAFVIGGLVCLVGEVIRLLLMKIFKVDNKTANTLMLLIFITLSSLFTGLGLYDKFGQIAGAGAFVPITGFANSLTSSAIESKSEGIVLGTMMNMFKLAGAIIVIGAVSSVLFGTIIYLLR